ncbi:hypothetical protein WN51_10867 [Melipona quadrifasciata]|uniref:Uncharacterized protein n=1 Tax=Melipona quadrifasciata TaxID=166423 RepID=A0A0N0BI65_9HYME|nr:hypothetical protein WN51_10867 [Melipona quadrifasciata]
MCCYNSILETSIGANEPLRVNGEFVEEVAGSVNRENVQDREPREGVSPEYHGPPNDAHITRGRQTHDGGLRDRREWRTLVETGVVPKLEGCAHGNLDLRNDSGHRKGLNSIRRVDRKLLDLTLHKSSDVHRQAATVSLIARIHFALKPETT